MGAVAAGVVVVVSGGGGAEAKERNRGGGPFCGLEKDDVERHGLRQSRDSLWQRIRRTGRLSAREGGDDASDFARACGIGTVDGSSCCYHRYGVGGKGKYGRQNSADAG